MSPVRTEAVGPVLLVTIDHPPINATSHAVRAGLLAAIDELSRRADLATAVLIGAGSTFIAGADIREFGQPAKDPSLPAVIEAIEACSKPVVAALHGSALGGGLEVALACDARIALKGTSLGLPEVTLGVVPGAGGTQRLPRRVGLVRGIEMVGRGERITAEEGLALRLLDAVVPDDLRAPAIALATRLVGRKCRIRDEAVAPADADAGQGRQAAPRSDRGDRPGARRGPPALRCRVGEGARMLPRTARLHRGGGVAPPVLCRARGDTPAARARRAAAAGEDHRRDRCRHLGSGIAIAALDAASRSC
jgi:3-hydroxyacyl-CoA dehydrogenase